MLRTTAVGTALAKAVGDAPLGKSLAAVLGAVLGYLFPDQAGREAGLAAFGMVLLDTLTGLAAAVATGQPVRSARFGRVVAKIFGYGATIAVCAVVTRHVPGAAPWQPVSVSAVVTLIIVTEAISVLENVRRLGVRLPLGLERALEGRRGKDGDGQPEPAKDLDPPFRRHG
ncbi:MAG: phage holin family protein [Fimbriimonadaceae bacterium]|nr:phage holin family protein [Fimbriimonadaceae bacterium]